MRYTGPARRYRVRGKDIWGDVTPTEEQEYIHERDPLGPASFFKSSFTLNSLHPEWDRFYLVRRGVLRGEEMVEYLGFYFSYFWPLLPVIPEYYSTRDWYASMAHEEPVLTIGLVALASRYRPLRGFNGQARSERVHWRTWPLVRKLFQSALWGSSAMRRPGAIVTLLLFIEWHFRAINSPGDFIDDKNNLELFETEIQLSSTDTLVRHRALCIPTGEWV